ncbi:MAG: Crp/Fnr family transcriptional regulator [Duncaniella sp.]|nr:Crp/Fnr family transcriptional regulator [Muribaculum sp.]MCM1255429.1 Crp/Fnr family transcriptional regulator [Duncaniella sp.]
MIKSTIEQIITEDLAEFWSVLSAEDKRLIIENFTIRHYKKNQIVYAEKDEPEYLWCLLDGKVKKYKDGIGGRVQIIRLIKPVEYFGYRAYFAGEHYVSSAATLEPSTLGTLPMTLVDELMHKNNQLALFFIHELSRNLGSSDTKIVNLTQKHIRGRLAEALMVLRDNYGYEEDDNMTLKIYMGREDLANLSNMTTSNAIRTLSTFVTDKLIVVDGRKIKILNEPELRKISKFG